MCYLFEANRCVLYMYGASCRAGLIQREAPGDNNEECSDWARKSTQHDLMYGFPTRLCLPAHIFWIRSALLLRTGPQTQSVGGYREKVLLHFSLFEGRMAIAVIVCAIYRWRWNISIPLIALLFCFCHSDSLIETVCTVQHSASVLIFEDSLCGRRVDHFLLAWKGGWFFC